MTSNKDLKRLVRARMKKTGEAYTSARVSLLAKRPGARGVGRESVPLGPAPSEYAALAGMSEAAIKAKTGCGWEEWVRTLDQHGAAAQSHTEIAKLLRTTYNTPSWWTQTIAVGYERIKGLRARGQQRDGSYQVSKSRTFGVSVDALFAAWASAAMRRQWLTGTTVKVRSATKPKSMRVELADEGVVVAMFTKKGPKKSSVAIEQLKLPGRDAATRVKEAWSQRFDALKSVLAPAART